VPSGDEKGHETVRIEKRSIIGVPVAQVTYDDMLRWIGRQVERPRPAETRVAVLANVHVLTEANLDPGYMRVLRDADLVAPDGMPLRWAGDLLGRLSHHWPARDGGDQGAVGTDCPSRTGGAVGQDGTRCAEGSPRRSRQGGGRAAPFFPLPDRCYGPELFQRALAASQEAGWCHYLYGATDDTLELMRATISRRWPRARIVGAASPPFGPLDDQQELANIRRMNDSGADLIWVGMGCPKQERWMNRYRKQLEAHVALGVGAGFDFLAGIKRQAPAWMQDHGLEWLHRLGTEPGRLWKRYLVRNPMFMVLLGRQLLTNPRRGGRP